jgi:DNA-directed RNA polymerase beta subunit
MSGVISRVTLGQVLELKASHVSVAEKRIITDVEYMERYGMEHCLNEGVVQLYYKGKPVMKKQSDGSVKPVYADWGYGRVNLLHHLTLDKHHYTRMESKSSTKYTAGGRSNGGSVKLGEMEIQALASTGMKHTLQEFANRRDMVKVKVCARCNRQCILCTCAEEHDDTRNMLIPYSTLSLDVVSAVSDKKSFEYIP